MRLFWGFGVTFITVLQSRSLAAITGDDCEFGAVDTVGDRTFVLVSQSHNHSACLFMSFICGMSSSGAWMCAEASAVDVTSSGSS